MNRIGIISGSGVLPQLLVEEAARQNIEPYIVLLKGSAEEELAVENQIWSSVTSVGKILSFFRDNNVSKIIFTGGIKRPPLLSLMPDITGAKLLKRILLLKKAGDDTIFREIIKFLEEEHFCVAGVDEIAPNLLMEKGSLGKIEPTERQIQDIEYGFEVAKALGNLDIGQAVIVQNGHILGVEAEEGTNALIERCAELQNNGRGAILIKTRKPGQDKRIDLPTIGTKTIEKLASLGYSGVAIEAGNSLLLEKEKVKNLASKNKIFVFGK